MFGYAFIFMEIESISNPQFIVTETVVNLVKNLFCCLFKLLTLYFKYLQPIGKNTMQSELNETRTCEAIDAANWLVDAFRYRKNKSLTHLKLQKLLYFAQAWYFNLHGSPMFKQKIEAWNDGPVVPDVYFALKKIGGYDKYDHIVLLKSDAYSGLDVEAELDNKIGSVLMDVYYEFADATSDQMKLLTHDTDPWKKARKQYRDSGQRNKCKEEITLALLKDFHEYHEFVELKELHLAA